MPSRRVAVVTGANKGIGLEIARQLAREGVTVYLGARDEARGRAAAEKLRAEGLDARPASARRHRRRERRGGRRLRSSGTRAASTSS